MAENSISYGMGLSDQQLNAMLNSDVPEIVAQAQDYINQAQTQQEEKPSILQKITDFFGMSSAGAAEPNNMTMPNAGTGFNTVLDQSGNIKIVPIEQPTGIMIPASETNQLDLVNQINQSQRNIGVPMTLEETMAGSVLPPDPRRFQSIFPTTGIMQQAPQTVKDTISSNLLYEDLPSGIDTSYGVANEEDVEEEIKKKGGIAEFLRTMLGFAIPGAGLFTGDRSALQGIKSLNQRLRNTDFARSSSLADYLDAKSYGGRDERDAAAARTMTQARGIQKKIDTGKYRRTAADNVIDRGRGESNIASRAPRGPTGARRGIDSRNRSSIDPAKGRKG